MIWSFVQQFGRQLSSYIIVAVLANLLNPGDFGLVGIVTVWINGIAVFATLGFSAVLIQRKNIESQHQSSVFFLNLGMGIALCFLGVIVAGPVAELYRIPEIRWILAIQSVDFIILSFSITQMAIAQREMRFRELALRDIAACLAGGIAGITLAVLRYGVWSLVAQNLVTSLIASFLLWKMAKWRPRASEFSLRILKELWGYSSNIFFHKVLKYFVQNSDKLIIGYVLGPVALGLYAFAHKIVLSPLESMRSAIGAYIFPKFSRIQDNPDSVLSAYLFINKAVLSIVIPAMVVIVFLSPTFISPIFGQKWAPAVPLIQILTVVGVIQSFIFPVGELMKALNRPAWLLRWSIFFMLITVLSVWIGSYRGIIGTAVGLGCAHVAGLFVISGILTNLLPVGLKQILKSSLPSAASSLVLSFLLWILVSQSTLVIYHKIILSLSTGSLTYIFMMRWLDRDFFPLLIKRFVRA